MTNLERIKRIFERENDHHDVVRYICDDIHFKVGCDRCPCSDRCSRDHNGIEDYLMEEVEE